MSYADRDLKEASPKTLQQTLEWNEALRDHYDENMDHNNYQIAVDRINQIKAELRTRG